MVRGPKTSLFLFDQINILRELVVRLVIVRIEANLSISQLRSE